MHFDLVASLRLAIALDGIGNLYIDFLVLDCANAGGYCRKDREGKGDNAHCVEFDLDLGLQSRSD